ncbi:MAG: hypothetical protein ABSF44_12925 [Candidatus Bathyarchaeia archaeon]|jgi:hypothetical protein
MCEDNSKALVEDFLKSSMSTVKILVQKLFAFKQERRSRQVTLFRYFNGKKVSEQFNGNQFFLRGSVEYTNPHLTVEEVQGIIGTRLLEVSANYFDIIGLHEPDGGDVTQICERLNKPTEGYVVPFLLNTDDVEADRYSMNPLKQSIVDSGQSAFPVAYVRTDNLKVDEAYAKKYDGSLISKGETELITSCLKACDGSYLDFVDSVKYQQLEDLSKFFGMNLSLYSLRMPLSTLKSEGKGGLLHHIINESHLDYNAVNEAYSCMGRSMSNRTTLLTVPHSKKGYGSKRAARGKIHFENNKLLDVAVKYKTTKLYPNAMDEEDIAVAHCDDSFTVTGEKLSDYNFEETPSSPQFFLYSLGSPENGAVWHGVGAFGSTGLLHSYSSARHACSEGKLIKNLSAKYGVNVELPLQFNLAPEGMWSHPIHRNIDASIGSIEDLPDLVRRGMKLEYLSFFK